jgi:hypothetical protein
VARLDLPALPPLDADEAGHALSAARMAHALEDRDARGFLAATESETTWPFVHAWFLAAAFLVFGISTGVARGASLAAFAATVVLSQALGRSLCRDTLSGKDPPAWSGVLTAVLVASSATFWMFATMAMTETLGMALTLAALVSAAHAAGRASALRWAVVGLLLAATCLAKYNYGIPLIAAVGGTALLHRSGARTRPARASLLVCLSAPILIWAALPFPGRLRDMLAFAVNRSEGLDLLDSLAFYPRSLVNEVSAPVALVVAVAALGALSRRPRAATLAAALFVALDLAMLVVHPNKQTRYAFTMWPVLYALAEAGLFAFASRATAVRPFLGASWIMIGGLILLLLDPRDRLEARREGVRPLRGAGEVFRYAAAEVRPETRILFLGGSALIPHLSFAWELCTRGIREPRVDYMPFPGDDGFLPRFRSGYPEERTPAFAEALERRLATRDHAFVVAVAVPSGSVFDPEWNHRFNAWNQHYVALMERQNLYGRTGDRLFPSGVRVRIYEPCVPSADREGAGPGRCGSPEARRGPAASSAGAAAGRRPHPPAPGGATAPAGPRSPSGPRRSSRM